MENVNLIEEAVMMATIVFGVLIIGDLSRLAVRAFKDRKKVK